jgi:hypothetical protein
MDRLLAVKLDAAGCEAEVRLNGVPLARANAARPSVIVPVHEYTVSGSNRLELVVWPPQPLAAGTPVPPPVPLTADGLQAAAARILLPRIGGAIHESSARTLAQLDWAPSAGTKYEAPVTLSEDVSLPVSFPRWRWLEARPHPAPSTLQPQALALVQALAQDLARGDADRFVATVRLRTEEIALAYQRRAEDEAARLRSDLVALHAAGKASWVVPEAEALWLHPVAGGRLLECLDPAGGPALHTAPDDLGQTRALPLRLGAVEGNLYVLR